MRVLAELWRTLLLGKPFLSQAESLTLTLTQTQTQTLTLALTLTLLTLKPRDSTSF